MKEEKWYTLRRVKRIKDIIPAPKGTGNLSNRILQGLAWWWVFPIIIHQEGIEQMNEKGRKRIIWEDDGCRYEAPE